MVKHIILWTLKETDADKKAEILANMKEHLEGLAGKVPGLLEVHVRTNPLASSNAEVMLDTTLENEEMLLAPLSSEDRERLRDLLLTVAEHLT